MTRRDFVWTVAVGASAGQATVTIPLRRVMDSRAKCTPEQLRRFSSVIWPEAIRDLNACGIQFQMSEGTGEIKRSPSDKPVFTGLDRGALNVVITDRIPLDYRSLAGVTTLWQGYHLCVIALSAAHGHQVPFLSTNTCLHEMLHALLLDIFLSQPKWYQTGERELRVDWYATRLWLFHDGVEVRRSAEGYLARLRTSQASSILPLTGSPATRSRI